MNPNSDTYSYINAAGDSCSDQNPTGFTNTWLENRANDKLFEEQYDDFPLYEQNGKADSYRDIIKTMQVSGPVSDAYFSDTNIAHLKKLVCREVYRQSGGQYNITPEAQSSHELVMIMRYIYLEHAQHGDARPLPLEQMKKVVINEVAQLNYQVMMDLVPRVISKSQEYLSYVRDNSQQHLIMDHPKNVNSAGTKSNQSFSKTYI